MGGWDWESAQAGTCPPSRTHPASPPHPCRYEAVQPLHQRWQQYIRGLAAAAPPHGAAQQQRKQQQQQQAAGQQQQRQRKQAEQQALAARLLGADLHGALLRVAECGEARYRGVQGVCVRDTAQTFQLVTPQDRCKQLLPPWPVPAFGRSVGPRRRLPQAHPPTHPTSPAYPPTHPPTRLPTRLLIIPKAACTWQYDVDERVGVTLLGPALLPGRPKGAPRRRRR